MGLLDKSFFGFGTQKSNILMKLFFTLATQRLNTLNQIGRRKNNRFSQVLTVYNLAMEKMYDTDEWNTRTKSVEKLSEANFSKFV